MTFLFLWDEVMGWRSKKYAIEYTGQRGVGNKDPSEDVFLSRFLPAVPPPVLDAGGGNGRWSLGFFELGYRFVWLILTCICSEWPKKYSKMLRHT